MTGSRPSSPTLSLSLNASSLSLKASAQPSTAWAMSRLRYGRRAWAVEVAEPAGVLSAVLRIPFTTPLPGRPYGGAHFPWRR